MLLPMKKNNYLKGKKGISIVIGYVLLIAVSIVMSVIVYQWISTYVPTDSVKCDEGTSLFITNINYDCVADELNVTIKNNGRFSIQGFFIHASNKTEGEIATIDLSHNVTEVRDDSGKCLRNCRSGNYVVFNQFSENALNPGSPLLITFNVSDFEDSLKKIEIIPARIQEVDGVKRLVTCGDAKIQEMIACE